MTIEGVGGVSGPTGPEGAKGPQRPEGLQGVDGTAGTEGASGTPDVGAPDRIEKVPELAPLFEKIHALPPQDPSATGEIAGLDPNAWGPEEEQRIQQVIDRILEEGI